MNASLGPATTTIERKVEWSDTDAYGHHHFTSILRWAEQAEFVLHERLGIADIVSGHCPRVHVSVDFERGAYARQIVEVDISVLEVGRTSVRYQFVVRDEAETIAEGLVAAVFTSDDGAPTRWPDDVRRLLLESGRVEGERYARGASDAAPAAG
jgi:acyl-CoA thioesterase FadM